METAQILGEYLGVPLEIRERMHENDRSATGFLPPSEFESVADEFFAKPEVRVRGWEPAIDAQARIRSEVDAVLARNTSADMAFVGHGGVGTLLPLSFAGLPISRVADQPAGGGIFSFDLASLRVHHA
ncbi:histidine phosphatase family protein [Mesorhizobium sp. M1076]|uniref:histidine phosphatase family protein n=1 Tax=Mesorhizobium sp. M1076 TaxID=2957054 RepID=UPI00333A977D